MGPWMFETNTPPREEPFEVGVISEPATSEPVRLTANPIAAVHGKRPSARVKAPRPDARGW
jgi:hypothetical protein